MARLMQLCVNMSGFVHDSVIILLGDFSPLVSVIVALWWRFSRVQIVSPPADLGPLNLFQRQAHYFPPAWVLLSNAGRDCPVAAIWKLPVC